MAWRLADSIIEGFFSNLKGKSTHGLLVLEGYEAALRFELTGDAGETLHGRSFQFRRAATAEPAVAAPAGLALMQIGPVGEMALRMARIPLTDPMEAYRQGLKFESEWVPLLYLEWYSQNGRMVLELADPVILLEKGEVFPELEIEDASGPGSFSVTAIRIGDDGEAKITEYTLADDDAANNGDDIEAYLDGLQSDAELGLSDDEILELDMGEKLLRREHGEYLASLLEPERLPNPSDVDEDEAKTIVMSLLIQLARRSVAVHLCHHCSYREAYRFIMEEIVYTEKIPPELSGSGWTMNYSYGETCPECDAEYEVRE